MLLDIKGLETEIPTRGGVVRPARGIDLAVRRGECLGIAGESGCGKTMLLLTIMRLLPPGGAITAGSIRFEEEDLVRLGEGPMRATRGGRIALVFQEPMTALNPVFTVGSQIVESIRQHRGMRKLAARRRAEELLRDLMITDPEKRLRQYPHELSGGMRQRVMLAAALGAGPSLVLADEPTSSLDVTVQAQIVGLLGSLREKYRLSLVFVSHDLALLSEVADTIGVMYLGRMVEVATTREVIERPLHPYTMALLCCIPPLPSEHRATGAVPTSFQEVPGELPDPTSSIPGCQFHPRCPVAETRCREAQPALENVTGTHRVACFAAGRRTHAEAGRAGNSCAML